MKTLFLILSAFTLALPIHALAVQEISADENWSGAVVLNDTVVVERGTLTVAAGTEITVAGGDGIRVNRNGALVAVGTLAAPVLLTGRDGAAIQLNAGRLVLEHCRLSGWKAAPDVKDSRSITGAVGTDGVRLANCRFENCGKVGLSLGGLIEVLACDFRTSSGVSVHGKGDAILVGNTLEKGSLATTRAGKIAIRDNVLIDGSISAFGCAELEIVGNYVHKPILDGGIGLHFADGDIRDNVLRGGSWTSGELTGRIVGNLFISLPRDNRDDVKKFNEQNTHEHVFGLKADAVVERNIFIGPSYGALMGIGQNNMSNSIIRHNTFDMHGRGYAVYMNHLVKSQPTDIEIYNNIFMRCEGVNDESSYLDSATLIDHNLWADAGTGKHGRFRRVRMTGKVAGDDGFGGNGIPAFGSDETLAIADVVLNPDVIFPFTDDDMLARKHSVAAVLAHYRAAYAPRATSQAVDAGTVRGEDTAVTDGKPDIGAVELGAVEVRTAGYEEKLLMTFDTDVQGWRAFNKATLSHSPEDGGCLELGLTDKGQGIFLLRGGDMSSWDKIKFDIHNDGPPVNVTFQARDAKHLYPCIHTRVATGPNTLEYSLRGLACTIPDHGAVTGLDLTDLHEISFRTESPVVATFQVDNVRLSRGPEPFIPPGELSMPENPVQPVPGNLIANPDFELGLQYWKSWPKWDGGDYTFGSVEGKEAHTGSFSTMIVCVKKGRGGVWSEFDVPRDGRYRIRFAVRGEGAARMRYEVEERTPEGAVQKNTPHNGYVDVTSDWQWVEDEWEGKASPMRLNLYHISEGRLYLDSVSFAAADGGQSMREDIVLRKAGMKPSVVEIKGDRTFVNGRPFFPIGIYGVSDPAVDFEGTGFNFALGVATDANAQDWYLKCSEAGVMTVANLTGLIRAHLGGSAASIVPEVRDWPSLFGYYLCDEPDHSTWNVPPAEIRQASQILNQTDPDHPTVVLVMGWHRSRPYQYGDSANILAADPYSGGEDMDKPVRIALAMDDAQAGKQPVWTVLQAVWGSKKPQAPQIYEGQMYSSIASGADGIFWFALDGCKKHPEVWDKIKALSLELAEIHDELCADRPEELQPTFSDPRIIGFTCKSDRGLLLVTVNQTLNEVDDVTISIPGLGNRKALELFNGGDVLFKDGKLKRNYNSGRRHVYRIEYGQ